MPNHDHAPKLNPARRNTRVGPLQLPRGGRKGPTPQWPLAGRTTKAEKELWESLWHTPQAAAWETMGEQTTRMVARYARWVILAEACNEKAAAEARQLEDRLGISPRAMRVLIWAISKDEVAERREEKQEEIPAVADVRARIKAVG